jgi:hypothetical protein
MHDPEKNDHLSLDAMSIVSAFSSLAQNITRMNELVPVEEQGVVQPVAQDYYEALMTASQGIFDYLVEKFCK